MDDPHVAVASRGPRWELTLAWLFVAFGAFWIAGADPLTSGVRLAVVALLPPILLFAMFTRGPSPRHEQALHTVDVARPRRGVGPYGSV